MENEKEKEKGEHLQGHVCRALNSIHIIVRLLHIMHEQESSNYYNHFTFSHTSVTLTASLFGPAPLTWSFTVLAKVLSIQGTHFDGI